MKALLELRSHTAHDLHGPHAAARLRADAADDGATVHLADALIAGTAIHHGLTIATRNTRDFDGLPVSTLNPWSD